MKITHTTMIHAKCPINDEWDYYTVEIEVGGFLRAEDINSVADGIRGTTETQEGIAEQFADGIREYDYDAKITIIGRHGQNVETTVKA